MEKSFFLLLQRQKFGQCSSVHFRDLALIDALAYDWQKTECFQGGAGGGGTKRLAGTPVIWPESLSALHSLVDFVLSWDLKGNLLV